MWYKNFCMWKRLKLGSDMVLEEVVTAARHSKSILLDILWHAWQGHTRRHPHVEHPAKRIHKCRCSNTSALVTQVTHTLYLQTVRVTVCSQKYVLVAEVEAGHGQEPPHSLTGVILPTEGISDPQYQFSQWNSLISSHCACNSLRLSIRNRFHFYNHNITVIFFQSRSLLMLNSEHIKRQ